MQKIDPYQAGRRDYLAGRPIPEKPPRPEVMDARVLRWIGWCNAASKHA